MFFLKIRKNRNFFVAIFLFLAIFFAFSYYSQSVRNFFYTFSFPINSFFWKIGGEVYSVFQALIHPFAIQKENEKLFLEQQKLLSEISSLKELKKENELLREALGLELNKEFNLVLARVGAKLISDKSILVDKGIKDGIKKNMPVITEQKGLVGRVEEVYDNFSVISLLFSKKVSFEAKILEKDIKGLVKGSCYDSIFFDLVPQYQDVQVGDLVVTTAGEGIFPPGIYVGRVADVKKVDVKSFQEISIEPSFDLHNLEYVFILKDYNR
jgi:rod shape-determining protein MreC